MTKKFSDLSTASMNLSRMMDSMCDSARVRRWLRHLFHASKLPTAWVCFLRRKAAVCSSLDVRYCTIITSFRQTDRQIDREINRDHAERVGVRES